VVESMIDSYLYSPILSCLSFFRIGAISSILSLPFRGALRNRAATRQPGAAPQDSPATRCKGFGCQKLMSKLKFIEQQNNFQDPMK